METLGYRLERPVFDSMTSVPWEHMSRPLEEHAADS